MTDKLCQTPTPCPMLLGKSGKCGHQVMHGSEACWRRDGRAQARPWKGSPFQYADGEARGVYW